MLLGLVACSNKSGGNIGNVNADNPPPSVGDSSDNNIDVINNGDVGNDDDDDNDNDDDKTPITPITPTQKTFDTSKIFAFKAVNTIVDSNLLDVSIPTYKDGENDIAYGSLTAISTAAITDKNVKQTTLQVLAVQRNDSSIYKRETINTLWDDEANLNINRQIQISRITPSTITLAFDENGNISAVTAYVDATYLTEVNDLRIDVDRSTIFGFDSDHMAYISWNSAKTKAELGNNTEDNIYNRNGMMIAGIEANDSSLFTDGKVAFKGKGSGTYGTKNTSFKTIFDVTAEVDFDAETVGLTTDTSCTDCGVFDASTLDFIDLSLSFANGNNISEVVTLGALAGTLDARFYGGRAQEFGGTFALVEENQRYYYGAFGSTRNGIAPFVSDDSTTLNALQTLPAKTNQTESLGGNDSLLAIADGNVTLKGLAILLDDTTGYARYNTDVAWADTGNLKIDRQITPTRITSAFVSLAFDVNNVASVTTIYANDDYITGTADRSTIFGFDSDYMAYISWQLSEQADSLVELNETSYHKDGMMIAGIEANDSSLFTDGKVAFKGKGSGTYGTKNTSFKTIFDVTAEVDFDAETVGLTTDTSCTDCGVFDASTLDFIDLSLSFANGNNISEVVTLGALAGTLDARFYGGRAQEFGGTFALVEENQRYYYGAFGSTRNGIAPFVSDDSTTLNALQTLPAKTNQTESLGGNDSLLAIADGNVTLKGLAILLDDTTGYARYNTDVAWADTGNLKIDRQITPTRITSAFVSLAFDVNNVASVTTIYANDDYITGTADRSTIFGFDSDHMAYISWNYEKTGLGDGVQDSIYNRNGIMIAGIETKNANIFDAGKAEFTGKGKGVYGSKTESFVTTFNVTAEIDFGKDVVDISTSDTACTGPDCNSLLASALNLKNLSLSFAGGNSISEDLSADTPTGTFIGKLDARFYGGQAQEFGGTFALSEENQRYYYGAFGTTRNGIAPFVVGGTTHIKAHSMAATTSQTEDLSGNDSLLAIANGNVTLQGLTILLNDTTDYARYNIDVAWADTANLKIDRQVTPTRITSSFVSLAFDVGNVASVTTIYADADYITGTVDRSAIFGFNSNYMAYINWGSDEFLDINDGALTQKKTDIDGMMIAGIQASDANIISSVGRVQFTGKGKGVYGTKTATEIASYDTIFDVTADVDFDVPNVNIIISNTVCDGLCNNVTVPTYLDFSTGLVTYTGNNISETVTLDSTLAGTLDARFYGNDVAGPDEFGGTFALIEADTRYYYGAFGASRHGVAAFLAGDITRLNTLGTITATTPQNITYSDNTTISGKTATTLTLKTVAVLDDDTTTYKRYTDATAWNDPNPEQTLNLDRQINVSQINTPAPAVQLTFDGVGDITTVRIYADKEYVTGDSGVTIDADNSNAVFGFNVNYMAYISWNSAKTTLSNTLNEDSIHNRNGIMIGGIESSDAKLTSHNKVARFEGKGRGTYGSLSNGVLTEYETIFDVTAKAYFHNRTLNIDVSGTQCTGACNNISVPTYLDDIAITDASFANGNSASNNFSHALTLDNTLTGTLDARFYGKNNSIAQEFGGTFALAQADTRYYYGAFGAERLVAKTPPAQAGFPTPFYDYDYYGYSTYHNDKTHNRISIDFSGTYLASTTDEKYYSISDLFSGANYHDSLSAYLLVSRDDSFSFKPKYMAHIGWDMKQIISYDADGNIVHPDDSIRQVLERENGNQVVGFHTPNNKVFSVSKGEINFTGKGSGLFIINKEKTNYQEMHTSFDVIAGVNFSTRKVNLQMRNTADCSDHSATATCNITTDSARLDFANILSYSSNSNIGGGISVSGIPGTASARFFGKDDTKEFGGTFLASATLSVDTDGYFAGDTLEYSGWFGTRREWVLQDTDNSVYRDSYGAYYDKPYAPLFIASNSGSELKHGEIVSGGTFDRVSDYANTKNKNIVITLENALIAEKISVSLYTMATATDAWIKNDDGRFLTQNDNTALAVAYNKTGHIVAAGAYFADGTKQYRSVSLDGQTNVTTSETSLTTKSGDNGGIYEHASIVGANHSLQVIERNNYMVTIGWEIFNSSAPSVSSHFAAYEESNIRGHAIGGFNTDDAHLLAKTGTASFTGFGIGSYQDDAVNDSSSVVYSVLAQVDFDAKEVNVRANTNNCVNGCLLDWPKVRFNYRATLNYDNASGNMLTGVATIDESNPQSSELSGTAQARFFGPNAEEFGGTFSIKNADATITYHGSFFTAE